MKITKCDICNSVIKPRAETAEVRINPFFHCYELCGVCARKRLGFFLKRAEKDEKRQKQKILRQIRK
ncbi:MAG: hypothetical protein Q8Q17_01225 [bacterium]|nr:hypothetical protein [bacterium]